MTTSETQAGKAYGFIVSRYRTSTELSARLYDILVPDSEFYRVNHPGGLPWLIGNGFTQAELSIVAEYVLRNNTDGIRERANRLIAGSAARRSAAQIVAALGYAHVLQLLFLLDDQSLVEVMETVIDDRSIFLSPTEVRRSFENRHLNGGYFRVDAEASRLGVRFVPGRQNLTEPRMLATFRMVFSGEHRKALSWQLRNEPGVDPLEKLERGLDTQDPRRLVKRILFSSQEALERTFDVLQYGRFQLPVTSEAEDALVEKILWKLGAPMPAPAPPQALLEHYATRLIGATVSEYADDESRILAVRGAGMDMFVELEELLRLTANFACWSLLNDHYDLHPLDRFRYSQKHAEEFSRKIYGDESSERGDAFPFDPNRGNTLSVLISCYRVLAEVCEARLAASDNFMRPRWQFPEFSNHSDVQQFPLLHTALFLDLRPDSQTRLVDSLRSVTLALTQVDVCEVRNSLGHPRESFPTPERLADAVRAIRSAIGSLSAAGLIPTIRRYGGESVDNFNRRKIRMLDGRGDEIIVSAPNQLMMLNLPSYQSVQIVMADALLSGSLQPVRFAVADDSEWAELWHHIGLINSWLNRAEVPLASDGPREIFGDPEKQSPKEA